MNKNRKLVYIWKQNLEFYDKLPNKSEVINRHLLELQNEKPKEDPLAKKLERIAWTKKNN